MSSTPRTLALVWLSALTLALATAAPCGAAAKPAGELLLNPGFEEPLEAHPWMPAAWDTSLTTLPTVFFGRDTFLVHDGRYAVSVANTTSYIPTWNGWTQTLLAGPELWGKDLVLTIWTRNNGVEGRGYVVLQAYRDTIGRMAKIWGLPRDAAGKRIGINTLDDPLIDLGWQRIYFSDLETDWVRREARVHVPRGTNLVCVRGGLLGTGQVLFDDASLRVAPARPAPAPAPGENLLVDPGFEGDGNAWEYSMPPYAGMRIDIDSTVAHSGRSSVRYTTSKEGMFQARAGACQPLGRGLAGKNVRLSAWVKTDSLRGGQATVRFYASSLGKGMVQSEPTRNFDLTNDWTRVSVDLALPPDAMQTWAWLMVTVPATGTVWFDDATAEVLGPSGAARPAPARKPAAPAAKRNATR